MLALLSSLSTQAQAGVAVILNPQCSLEQISDKDLAQVFLSKTKYLPSGERARPVELTSTESKNNFYEKIAGKNEVELRKYWATMIFTGNGQPPKQLRSVEQVLQYVSTHQCAIAYVPKDAVDESIKVLRRID